MGIPAAARVRVAQRQEDVRFDNALSLIPCRTVLLLYSVPRHRRRCLGHPAARVRVAQRQEDDRFDHAGSLTPCRTELLLYLRGGVARTRNVSGSRSDQRTFASTTQGR
jgi:hypothetical protein